MIITCGQCQAKFKVAPEQIKETGSKVRCSHCRNVFTVYRPKREIEKPVAAASPQSHYGDSDDDGNRYAALAGKSSPKVASPGFEDDYYGGEPDPKYGDNLYSDERETGAALSLKERRDRRRQLYSDMEEPAENQDYDDPLDDMYGEDGGDFEDDDPSGLPPLRRTKARLSPKAAEPDLGDYEDEMDDEDEFEERDDNLEVEDERPRATGGDLGLGADPVDEGDIGGGAKIDPFARLAAGYEADQGSGIRAAITRTRRKPRLAIILTVIAALLAVGIYFLSSRPEPTSLVSGDEVATPGETSSNTEPEVPVNSTGDATGSHNISFASDQHSYFYRENKPEDSAKATSILIITGLVRNDYPEPRSFIKLRGHLLGADEKILADRFVYAGNALSEDELKTLPLNEIYSRLMIKGGHNNTNKNVAPGTEIPFMVVFGDLPDGMEQYRIDVVSSDPAE